MVNVPDKSPASEAEQKAAEMQAGAPPADDPPAQAADTSVGDAASEAAATDDVEPGAPPESARDRVARRYAERRQADIDGNPIPIDEPPGAVATPEPPPQPAPEDPILKLKVDGRELELPQSEVIRLAQTNSAIEARGRALAELNLEINRKREELANASRTAPAADTSGARPRPAPPPVHAPREHTGLHEAQLRDIAERITSGTIEEQTAALMEFAEATRQPPAELPDVDGRINAALAERDQRSAVNDAVAMFGKNYADIRDDTDLQYVAYNRTVAEMLTDLEKAGVQPGDMAKLRGANPIHVARAHRAFNQAVNPDGSRSFPAVRDYQAVLKSAGDYVMQKFRPGSAPAVQPQPKPATNGLAARTDLKRGLTPTPRASQLRAEPRPDTPPGGNPNAKAAVSKIAALRNRGRGALLAH